MCDTVASQLVRHETARFLLLTLEECPKESARRTRVPAGLHEDIGEVTILIHRAPQILALAMDPHEHFVQEPGIAESTLTSLQPPSVAWAELSAPLPNGFVRHDDASFGQEVLDISDAQAVSVVDPHGVADNVRRKPMPDVSTSSRLDLVSLHSDGLI